MESAVVLMAVPSESMWLRRSRTLLRLASMSPLRELRRLICRWSSLVLVLSLVAVSEIFFSVVLLSFLTDSRVRVAVFCFVAVLRVVVVLVFLRRGVGRTACAYDGDKQEHREAAAQFQKVSGW